jgi:hypothetical protein
MPVAAAIGATMPRFGSLISQDGVRVTRYSGRVDWLRQASRISNEVEVVVFSRTFVVLHDFTRVAAVRCCGWERSLPIGYSTASGWVVGVRPGCVLGPADLPDLVLGGFLALFRGFSQIMLAFSIRHAREEAAASGPARPQRLDPAHSQR